MAEVGLYRHGQFETLTASNESARLSARLAPAKTGGMWVCLGSELLKINEGAAIISHGHFKVQSDSTTPTAMIEDHMGAVWIGTSDSGLFRFDGSTFESIPGITPRNLLPAGRPGRQCLGGDRRRWSGPGSTAGGDLKGMQSSLPFEIRRVALPGVKMAWCGPQPKMVC